MHGGVERALRQLDENGYKINFGESGRADGGSVMRGNDLLMGSVDVMVTDTLTGNILMKMFSSFTLVAHTKQQALVMVRELGLIMTEQF